MKYLKQTYDDAGGFIAFAATMCAIIACIMGAIGADDYWMALGFICLLITFALSFHHAALRFRSGREIGKVEGLKRAVDIARGVKND